MAKTQKTTDATAIAGVYGDPSASELTWEVRNRAFTRRDPRKAITDARKWAGANFFMSALVKSKVEFCNYGMALSVEHRAKKAGPQWTDDNIANIRAFVAAAWREWLSTDNLVLLWREKPMNQRCPISMLRPEDTTFTDALGIEILRIENALTYDQKQMIADPLRSRYNGAEVVFGDATHEAFNKKYPAYAEYFRVRTRGLPGHGYGFPLMQAVFPALQQCESMEVGEEAFAFLGRRVTAAHKLGHEIKNGPKAGMPTFHWKKQRAAAVETLFKAKTGMHEVTVNFDHAFEVWWVDQEKYNASKWSTVIDRIALWSGALGLIYASKGVNTDILSMFKVEVLQERRAFAEFITPIVQEAFKCPGDLTISWRNNCFENSRLAAEMLKWAQASAVVSVQTAREEYVGEGSSELESKRLTEEKKDPDANTPGYSPSHGKKPDLSTPGGRPAESQ